MASYVVMEPPGGNRGEARFERDGFAVFALVLPVIWLAWKRLWVEAAVALAIMVGLAVLAAQAGQPAIATGLEFLLALYVALEGRALEVAGLVRRGWYEAGVVDAQNRDEAEIRWFAGHETAAPAEMVQSAAPRTAPLRPPMIVTPPEPAFGLIDFNGGR